MYREVLPQLNLRQWISFIYTSLTQPVFDPTHSGRVTMDYLMKLVTIPLEWSYEAHDCDVRAETLMKAVELLVLRRDTFWVIDGAGPDARVKDRDGAVSVPVNERGREQETRKVGKQRYTTETSASSNCTFSGVVPIDLERFTERCEAVVECPGCSRTRSLFPSKEGILRFPLHKPRKMQTPVTGKRWSAKGKTDGDVVGGQ